MATYKKRGYKPKNKAEEARQQAEDSTTAEVFSSLDSGASRTEQWVARNQTYILGFIGVIAVGVLAYLGYQKFIQVPREAAASNELFYPMEYFRQAQQPEAPADSLYTLALDGAEGKYGLLDIIDEYSGTRSANLARYAAGISYLHLDQYDQAISYLEDKAGLTAMELGNTEKALEYFSRIEDEFPQSAQANGVEALIGMAKAGS